MKNIRDVLISPGNIASIFTKDMRQDLFPSHFELIPQLNEIYELELAYYESQLLGDEELIKNGAYFLKIGEVVTRHFLICSGEPLKLPNFSSSRLKSFFKTNQFKTGYSTHGLFPYRGKFHPQMIKAIINIMGLKANDTILDPMMGSGTVLIESQLMGINSIGVDISPFCRFMTQTKLDALIIALSPIHSALNNCELVYKYFKNEVGQPIQGCKIRQNNDGLFSFMESEVKYTNALPKEYLDPKVYNFLLLAYLDSVGYSERSNQKSPFTQFKAILERYLFTTEKIQKILSEMSIELSDAKPIEGDARNLPLGDSSVDGILFSPPYSFAIDYLENDSFHLNYMGVDIHCLREKMTGLRGKTLHQKFEYYQTDMKQILSECARVLRPGKVCTIIIGTNNNQLSKILGKTPEDVPGIDELIIELGAEYGFRLIRKIGRQIMGLSNTMRQEYIVFLQLTK
jgi:SAM-dependent methyltransferase